MAQAASLYLNVPLRTEAQARSDIAAARARRAIEPTRFRWYLDIRPRDGEFETVNTWAPTLDQAERQLRERAPCTVLHRHPYPDAMTLPTGGAVLLDRDQARRIALCIALNSTNQKAA